MPQMIWPTLKAVRDYTRLEGLRAVAVHHYVRSLDDTWSRTLGPPGPVGKHDVAHYHQVSSRVWHRVM